MSATQLLRALQDIERESTRRGGSLARIQVMAAAALATQANSMAPAETIKHDGDEWRVLSMGLAADHTTYCHLASTTRGHQQRNGWMPLQIADWIDDSLLYVPVQTSEQPARQR